MQSLGDQLVSIIKRKAKNLEIAEEQIAIEIRDEMLLNTKSGKAFGNDEYDNTYSQNYAKRKKGGKSSPVTLRDESLSIERATVTKNTISFPDSQKGYIFKLHHEGRAKGGKTRSIFPKSAKSVGEQIKLKALSEVKGVLNGV